jgi:hypothetical protein
MKNKLKKIALASGMIALACLVQLAVQPVVRAAYNNDTATGSTNIRTGNVKITDTGIYDSNGTVRYQPGSDNHFTGNLSCTGGQQAMGTVGVILSTANTSGFSAGQLYYAYLGGTVNALEGSALVATTPVAGQGVTVAVAAATANLTTVVGVASAAVSTGSVVGVYSYGWALALTTGTVNAGDVLTTSSASAGYLAANVVTSTGAVGVALASGNSAGGRIRIRLK